MIDLLTSLCVLAGFSSRMGQPKQHALIGKSSFLELILHKLARLSSDIERSVFVGQASDDKSSRIIRECGHLWCINDKPEDGTLSSIRVGIRQINESSAIMLWPVDHPMPGMSTLKSIIEAHQQEPDKIIIPSDGRRRGHPTIFPAWCRKQFFEIPLATGAKRILHDNNDKLLHVTVSDPWILRNLNTPQDLLQAESEVSRARTPPE